VFFLAVLGAGWRLFTKDLPSQGNRAITAYFIVLQFALGIVLRMMPEQGFGSF
jgi:hypothetical protein